MGRVLTPSLVNVGRHRSAMADAEALARRGTNSVTEDQKSVAAAASGGCVPPPTSPSGRGPFENGRVVVVGDSLRTVWPHNISATILQWSDIYTPGVLSPSEDRWLIVPLGRDWRLATGDWRLLGRRVLGRVSSPTTPPPPTTSLTSLPNNLPACRSRKCLVPNISSRTTIRYGFHSGTVHAVQFTTHHLPRVLLANVTPITRRPDSVKNVRSMGGRLSPPPCHCNVSDRPRAHFYRPGICPPAQAQNAARRFILVPHASMSLRSGVAWAISPWWLFLLRSARLLSPKAGPSRSVHGLA
jgi:hypothetical protein